MYIQLSFNHRYFQYILSLCSFLWLSVKKTLIWTRFIVYFFQKLDYNEKGKGEVVEGTQGECRLISYFKLAHWEHINLLMGRSLQDGETGENCVRETHIWNKIPDKTQKNKSTVIKKKDLCKKKMYSSDAKGVKMQKGRRTQSSQNY